MNVSAKMAYLARMTTDRLLGRHLACPNCDAADHIVVDRKYLVTELRRCRSCRLLFRAPTDSSTFNQSFYNDGYEQGFTTELPDDATLRRWMDSCFAGTPKDYAPIVDFLNVLGIAPPARIFDFGCSWGYGSWQMARAGYDVWASEISRPRSQFAASKLGVRLVDPDRMTEFQGSFDLFFSSHVLEHVPRIADVIELARRLLHRDGLFLALTPNGSFHRRKADPFWSSHWGSVHPNFLDEEFYTSAFADVPLLVLSRDSRAGFPSAVQLPTLGTELGPLEGDELVAVARAGAWVA
jgi:2-polyprenyl-3-methyl-5-hydroxy-6-metoxy-1,4-benzoquinol methylase